MQPVTPARRPLRTGFFMPLEMMYAPGRAFAAIANTPEWLPAFVLASLVGVLGMILAAPAMVHAFAAEMTALQGTTPGAAQEAAVERVVRSMIDQIILPLMSWGFTAIVFSLVAPGEMKPLRALAVYFALAANTGLIDAVSTLVFGAVLRMHDPASFQSLTDLILAVPDSLASLRPDGQPAEIAALDTWDIFALWTQILLGYGLAAISGRRLLPSLGLSFSVGLVLWYVYFFLG